MPGLATFVSHWLGSDRIATLAERVAGRSRLGTWQRVMDRLPQLGPTEARGYVRARAISVVRVETARLIEQEGPRLAAQQGEIEAAAMEQLVEMISAQVRHPGAHASRRRAA